MHRIWPCTFICLIRRRSTARSKANSSCTTFLRLWAANESKLLASEILSDWPYLEAPLVHLPEINVPSCQRTLLVRLLRRRWIRNKALNIVGRRHVGVRDIRQRLPGSDQRFNLAKKTARVDLPFGRCLISKAAHRVGIDARAAGSFKKCLFWHSHVLPACSASTVFGFSRQLNNQRSPFRLRQRLAHVLGTSRVPRHSMEPIHLWRERHLPSD